MNARQITGPLAGLFLAVALAACGGGGGGDSTQPAAAPSAPTPAPAPAPTPVAPNSVQLASDYGDYIGGGKSFSYSASDSTISISARDNAIAVHVVGDQTWDGTFKLPASVTTLQVGTYGNLGSYPLNAASTGGLSWSGDGRGCDQYAGTVTISSVTYAAGALSAIDFTFTQYCGSAIAGLHGTVHWTAADKTTPAGPQASAPAGLWSPPSGATPASGNYIYLASDSGDYIGGGATYLYTPANAVLRVAANGGHLALGVTGDQNWSGDFQTMNSVTSLLPGYYGSLARYPFQNPVRGGFAWTGEGRGCNTSLGWVVIDKATYDGGALTALDARFEQRCEGGTTALHGAIHWVAADASSQVAGPVTPVPAQLWTPAAGSTPASGNYIVLASDAGDYIGGGASYQYTTANAILSVKADGGHLTLGVTGDQDWTSDFLAMTGINTLAVGYYAGLQRYPFNNPVRGGFAWTGQGRGCNTSLSWFVVDKATYVSGTLTALDARFEQHCEGGTASLHGAIHWVAADNGSSAAGPVNPPPAGLWTPSVDAVPASGNYVYLASDFGDYIGGGGAYLYTQANAVLSVSASGGHLQVGVTGDQGWNSDFQTMNGVSTLAPGYYAGLQRYPFHNPVRGGFAWTGDGRGCNTSLSWVVIDRATYSAGVLTALDARFEQHCEGGTSALHGAIHWTSTDTTAPAGPAAVPAGLWSAPAGTRPASGTYVYLSSDAGDYIGGGGTALYTPPSSPLAVGATGGRLQLDVGGWDATFQAMSGVTTLQPGYYANLQRYPFNNPVRGGFAWTGNGRGCNTSLSWFVIDNATYVAGVLTALDARFEQHCEGLTPALHGQVHWVQPSSSTI